MFSGVVAKTEGKTWKKKETVFRCNTEQYIYVSAFASSNVWLVLSDPELFTFSPQRTDDL